MDDPVCVRPERQRVKPGLKAMLVWKQDEVPEEIFVQTNPFLFVEAISDWSDNP